MQPGRRGGGHADRRREIGDRVNAERGDDHRRRAQGDRQARSRLEREARGDRQKHQRRKRLIEPSLALDHIGAEGAEPRQRRHGDPGFVDRLAGDENDQQADEQKQQPAGLDEQPRETVPDRNVDVDAHPHHVVDVGGEAPGNDREVNEPDGRGEIIFRRADQPAKTDATPEIRCDGDRDQGVGRFDRRHQPGAYAGERGEPEICRRPLGARD